MSRDEYEPVRIFASGLRVPRIDDGSVAYRSRRSSILCLLLGSTRTWSTKHGSQSARAGQIRGQQGHESETPANAMEGMEVSPQSGSRDESANGLRRGELR